MANIKAEGVPLDKAKKAAILIHGRGANAASILGLSKYLKLDDYALWLRKLKEARGTHTALWLLMNQINLL